MGFWIWFQLMQRKGHINTKLQINDHRIDWNHDTGLLIIKTWGKCELKKFWFSSVSARKLKCPSSARLEPEHSSSGSSLADSECEAELFNNFRMWHVRYFADLYVLDQSATLGPKLFWNRQVYCILEALWYWHSNSSVHRLDFTNFWAISILESENISWNCLGIKFNFNFRKVLAPWCPNLFRLNLRWVRCIVLQPTN